MSRAFWLMFALGLVTLSGCGPKALPAAKAPPIKAPAGTLHAGDTVELKFHYASELNDTQVISPQGTLTLQLVGEVKAAGMTSAELSAELQKRYTEFVKYPGVSVIVRNAFARRVIVSGEVLRPGYVEMPAQLTALESILIAGGFNLVTGDQCNVIVMRKEANGDRQGYLVDLLPDLRGDKVTPFQLEPEDIVFVPRTPITNVNQFMQQWVAGVIPVPVSYSHSLGSGAVTLNNR